MGSSDSKLQFKSMFSRLSENYIKHNEHNFWKLLFIQPLSLEDIFSVISPDDIRNLRKFQPANLATIIYKCIEQLYLFSQPKNYFSESTSAKNSLHLLTRILPFIFEHDEDHFVKDLFFNNILPGYPSHQQEQILSQLPQQQVNNESSNANTNNATIATTTTNTTTSDEGVVVNKEQEDVSSINKANEEVKDNTTTTEEEKKEQQQPIKEDQKEEEESIKQEEKVEEPKQEQEKVEEQKVVEEEKKEEEVKPTTTTTTTNNNNTNNNNNSKNNKKKNKKKNKKNQQSSSTPTKEEPKQEEKVEEQQPKQEKEEESKQVTPTTSVEEVKQVLTNTTTTTEQEQQEQQKPTTTTTTEEEKKEQQQPIKEDQKEVESKQEQQSTTSTTSSPSLTATTTATTIPNNKILKIGDHPLSTTLAHILIETLMKCLFLPEFTIPKANYKNQNTFEVNEFDLDDQVLWEVGLIHNTNESVSSGTSVAATSGKKVLKVKPTWEQLDNRNDILRCLLTLFSGVLYVSADQCTTANLQNEFLNIATAVNVKANTTTGNTTGDNATGNDTAGVNSNSTSDDDKNVVGLPHQFNLLVSLLNFISSYDPRGSLPYSSQLFTDYYQNYIETSLHVLCILLQHNSNNNNYILLLKQLNNLNDFNYLYDKLTLILRNVVDSHSTYLPNSQKLIEFYEEILMLYWLILNHHLNFRKYICKELDITKLLIPLLFIIQLNCTQTIKYPIVQLSAFTILILSGCREFGVSLNRICKSTYPMDIPNFDTSHSNYADLIILFFSKIMVNDKGIIRNLYDCLLTIISNISPYIKSLSVPSCVKLLNLFEAFASVRFLYSNERNHQYVQLLLETFNNIIQYQYTDGNIHLIYSILRRSNIFRELQQNPDLEVIRQAIIKKHETKQKSSSSTDIGSTSGVNNNTIVTSNEKIFLPTNEWLQSWKPKLPLFTILILLDALTPEIDKICKDEYATEEDVLNYLKNTTLVGLLPVPHTIIIRTFQGNDKIDTFLITFIWGLIYIKMSHRLPWVDSKSIKLFHIATAASIEQQQQSK
ncbi:hypothetical protein ABK040_008684 [Willaertia magna]